MKNLAAGILMSCALTSGAVAQCNIFRHGIPDFDQRREGLPGNGGMYCVPTSAINLLAYAANHGVPSALDGPRNWQSQNNYNFVTQRINVMGALMGTHAQNGTNGTGALGGLSIYTMAFAPGKFNVFNYYGDYTSNTLVQHFVLGRLVNVCYGYYEPDSIGRYARNGGHCVSLAGIMDFCEPVVRLRWRDPANGDNNLGVQATFGNTHSDASSQLFIDTSNLPHSRLRLWDLGSNSTTRRYLDGITTLTPRVALTGGITTRDRFRIRFPLQIRNLTPQDSDAVIPGSDPIDRIVLDNQQINAFVTTFQDEPRRHRLFSRNLATGDLAELLASEAPFPITTSRFGDLFVHSDQVLSRYAFEDGVLTRLQDFHTPSPVRTMTYDDTHDEIVALTTNGRLLRIHHSLDFDAIDYALPAGVQIQGEPSIAIDEANRRFYIGGSDGPTIFIVGLAAGTNRPILESSLLLPAVQRIAGLQFADDGALVVMSDNALAEFIHGPAGWQPRQDSDLTGLPAAGAFVIGRSRTNFVAGVHDGPEWRNVVQDEGVPEIPDCAADFNHDGVLNSQDFFDFLTPFFTTDIAADFNFDGVINSQDLFDYLTAFFNGCN